MLLLWSEVGLHLGPTQLFFPESAHCPARTQSRHHSNLLLRRDLGVALVLNHVCFVALHDHAGKCVDMCHSLIKHPAAKHSDVVAIHISEEKGQCKASVHGSC